MMLIIRSFAVALLSVALGSVALAQDQVVDPPGRAARLSEFSGQVWLYNTDSGEWVAAVRNRPVTAGDRLATDAGARAELQLGSTTVRLDAGTELEVVALDDDRFSLHLLNGSVGARILDPASAGQFDLTTDEGRFVVARAGSYRFDRDGSTSRATVYSGQARYEGPNSGLPIAAGQRAEFWIDSGGVAQYTTSAPVNDAFAAWNNDQDRRAAPGVASRYVSPEMTGAEELDRYGRWEQSPDYGALWIPTAVAVDWAPYRNGHWAWVQPWGWTWVDDAPWGFAPFHYGRWVYVRNNWCWTPGARVVRPVYAPALVAWMGGPRANVSINIGGGPAVGWFPLAPREVYVPSYRVSPRYAQNINITHVTNVTVINNVFANPQGPREFGNRRFPNAITVVPTAVMTARQPVAPAAAQLRQNPAWSREIANVQPGRGAATLIAPPVAAPPMRSVDPRNVRPPPGVAERPAGPRPGMPLGPDRDRDGRGREVGRPDNVRPTPPVAAQQPATPAAPAAQPAQPPGPQRGVMRPPAENVERRDATPQPAQQPTPQPAPRVDDRRDDRRGDDRRRGGERNDAVPRPPVSTPAPTQAPAPVAPAVNPRPAAAPPVQEGPMMRPLPVHRDEERRVQPRPAEAPPAVNEQRQPPPQRVERPAPAVVPAPVVRPAEPARPVEAQRPAPAPEVKRAEPPRPRNESPAVEQKRGESRDPRDQK